MHRQRWIIATPPGPDGPRSPGRNTGIRLTIAGDDLFRHLIVYTPDDKPYFAVEPASNMTDAVNHMDTVPDHGLRVLHPGDTLQRQVRFTVQDV